MRKLLLALGIVLVIGGLAWQYFPGGAEPPTPLPATSAARVDTSSGPVIGGRSATGGFAWLGLPYAAPPVGELRWRTPQAVAPWTDLREALVHGPSCAQFSTALTDGLSAEDGAISGSEDCLTLSVYAPVPQEGEGPLPVMFWIHGGGNTIGTGATYDGSELAASERVVVVSINYRLGVLGWFSHPALRAQAANALDASGNFGVLDMVAALTWVRDNIRAFGGDPQQVTIFGESAGGRDVFALLVAPQARGLFHRAIAQSGLAGTSSLSRAEGFHDDPRPGHSNSSSELLVKWLQASSGTDREGVKAQLASMSAPDLMAYLRGLAPEELLAPLYVEGGMYRLPQMFRDGTVLPEDSLLTVFANTERWNAVPLMTGTTRDEFKLFQFLDRDMVRFWLGFLPRVRDADTYNWRARWFSDRWRVFAVDEVAAAITSAPDAPPVYTYRFDWDNMRSNWLIDLPLLLGAAHSIELDFIFHPLIGAILPGMFHDDNATDVAALTATMRGYWGAFAHSGAPDTGSAGDLPPWPDWANAPGVMVLDGPEGGGPRHESSTLRVADLKARMKGDPRLTEPRRRCEMYVNLFLANGGVEDHFDTAEYQQMNCAEFPPWSLALNP
ncbi:MAG: carboxylesterase family protein [Pseudomonadota bacterium]